jgi:hypothetical protein
LFEEFSDQISSLVFWIAHGEIDLIVHPGSFQIGNRRLVETEIRSDYSLSAGKSGSIYSSNFPCPRLFCLGFPIPLSYFHCGFPSLHISDCLRSDRLWSQGSCRSISDKKKQILAPRAWGQSGSVLERDRLDCSPLPRALARLLPSGPAHLHRSPIPALIDQVQKKRRSIPARRSCLASRERAR